MTYQEIISKVSEELGLSKTLVDKTYRAYWGVIREHIISLPLKEDLTDEEFLKLRPHVNLPSIGKLYVTLERYHNVKNLFNIKKKDKMLHIKKIKPMFTSIITTAEVFEKDYKTGGIITAYAGDIKPWQKIIAVGTSVRDLKEGDMVMINLANYVVRKYDKNSLQNDLDNNPKAGLRMNYVTIDDKNGKPKEYFLLNDRDILYSFEGEEKEDLIMPFNQIVGVK